MGLEVTKHSHEERVEIARHMCKAILKKHGDKILAVYISGSTAKELDRPYSDLEMITIVHDGIEIPQTCFIYNGLVVGVDYCAEHEFLKQAGRITRNWPLEADQYRNKIVLYDSTHWTKKLDEAVAHSDKLDTREAVHNLTVSLFEGIEVMKNSILSNDETNIRSAGYWFASDAASLVLLLSRTYVKTSSWFWRLARESKLKPPDFWENIERLAGFVHSPPGDTVKSAEYLATELLKIVESQGISIEARELRV